MYDYLKIKKLAIDLQCLAEKEYNYLLKMKEYDERVKEFLVEKKSLREELDKLLPCNQLSSVEKDELRDILVKTQKIELEIGSLYKSKLESVKENIGNLNKEKKLQEAYAKSGMNFTGENNNLK